MDTSTMTRSHRKAVKRAIRKHRRADTVARSPLWGGGHYLGLGPFRRRAGRTRMDFARAWNRAARAGGLRLPLISGITLIPYGVAALPSATATTSES